MKRTSETVGKILRHWTTRLRRDDAVAFLVMILYLLVIVSAAFLLNDSIDQVGEGEAYRRPTMGILGRIELMPSFPELELTCVEV